MSGGVDSTVSASILTEAGYEPIGVTLRTWRFTEDKSLEQAIIRAGEVCRLLNIDHWVVDVSREFEDRVVKLFVKEYFSGLTPNPCVYCNRVIKWNTLRRIADEMQIYWIATGHYANVRWNEGTKRYEILKGADPKKEQSYALWQLSQDDLSRTLFPVGNFTKSEIYRIAKERNIFSENVEESQDVCFIPNDDYRAFLKRYASERTTHIGDGELVDENGNVVGHHDGYYLFTVGQRKGFKIGFSERKYVKSIDPNRNLVFISNDEGLFADQLKLTNVNWVGLDPVDEIEGIIKIRYNHQGAKCVARRHSDGTVTVLFDKPQRSISPGQSGVLYCGNALVFGGIIQK